MTPAFALRPLVMGDLAQVENMEQRCFSTPWSRGQLIESLHRHHHLGILVEPLIGYAFFMTLLEEIHLLNLVVDPPWQGQGWGKKLLDAVIDQAKTQGAQSLLLEVRASNEAAKGLYQQAHFDVIGIRRGYYVSAQQTREDALVMRRMLG